MHAALGRGRLPGPLWPREQRTLRRPRGSEPSGTGSRVSVLWRTRNPPLPDQMLRSVRGAAQQRVLSLQLAVPADFRWGRKGLRRLKPGLAAGLLWLLGLAGCCIEESPSMLVLSPNMDADLKEAC